MSAEKSVQQQRADDGSASFTDYFKTYVNGWVAAAITYYQPAEILRGKECRFTSLSAAF